MQHAIRTVGIGLGFFVGFVCLCYFAGWLLIKCNESARDIFESEFKDLGQRSGTFLFGLVAILCATVAGIFLYLFGTIFVYPGLAFLAYMSGSISREEYLELVRMWEEEHETCPGN